MIQINDKRNCCGCFSCYNICPKQCINMITDDEGFLYPTIDYNQCVNCHLCEKHCPILQQHKSSIQYPIKIYGCRNNSSDELNQASSGGIFELFAKKVLSEKGLVCGAEFDKNWNVRHAFISSMKDIKKLRGSKYIQSNVNSSYKEAEKYLKEKQKVLFVGTPCQIAGLHSYLKKEYDNLLTIDFVCHGVPSPKVWQKYLHEKFDSSVKIEHINFRSKKRGWPNYCIHFTYAQNKIKYESYKRANKDFYMRGFLHDLYLRPSCYYCKFKGFTSKSDITLSDFWGVWKNYPKWNDQKGASCVSINSKKGFILFESLREKELSKIELSFKQAYIDYNHSAIYCTPYTPKREVFFRELNEKTFLELVSTLTKESLSTQIKHLLFNALNSIKSKFHFL